MIVLRQGMHGQTVFWEFTGHFVGNFGLVRTLTGTTVFRGIVLTLISHPSVNKNCKIRKSLMLNEMLPFTPFIFIICSWNIDYYFLFDQKKPLNMKYIVKPN